jgi:hypothetical protein
VTQAECGILWPTRGYSAGTNFAWILTHSALILETVGSIDRFYPTRAKYEIPSVFLMAWTRYIFPICSQIKVNQLLGIIRLVFGHLTRSPSIEFTGYFFAQTISELSQQFRDRLVEPLSTLAHRFIIALTAWIVPMWTSVAE